MGAGDSRLCQQYLRHPGEVTGLERIPEGTALIASRHQPAFDTLVWMTLLPRCCYVVKQELLRIPLFGKVIIGSGMIVIDRTSQNAALRALLREGDRAVHEGRQMRPLRPKEASRHDGYLGGHQQLELTR